jgi:phage host-nuclease inhibitor protein Gam
MEEANTAISIKGKTQVYKEQLESARHMVMIEIEITDIKSDVTRVGSVISDIKAEVNERYVEIMKDVYTEMMS